MVIMAVDYGDVRTGVAVCDKYEMLGVPLTVVREEYAPRLADRIAELADEKKAELLVLGLPRNMDGSEGFRAQSCRDFAELLRGKTGLEVVFWDERLTSVIAHAQMRASGKKEKKHRQDVDAAASAEILNSYLNARKNGR